MCVCVCVYIYIYIYIYICCFKKNTREGGCGVVVVVQTRHTMDTIGTMNNPAKLSNIGCMPTPYFIKFVSLLYRFGVIKCEMFCVCMKV